MEKKTITLKVKKIDGVEVKMQEKDLVISSFKALDDAGTFEAHVSVFGNVDSYGEVVDKGAFTEWLTQYAGRYPKGVWSHNWDEPIIKTLECREDEIGLYVKGQFVLEVQRAREIYALMKAGVITDFSFGFAVMEDSYDEATGLRHLKKIAIYEYSPVLVGANREATLIGVKADGEEEGAAGEEPEAPAAVAEGEEGAEATPAEATAPVSEESEPAAGADEAVAEPAPAPAEAAPASEGAKDAAISAALDALKAATIALEALKGAAEDAPAATGADTSEVETHEGKGDTNAAKVVKAILRDARKADKIVESIIVRAKRI